MANFIEKPHRMFIQAMMWKKICSDREVKQLHRMCHEKSGTHPGDLKVFVEKINAAINLNNMNIKKGKDELTGEDYYVLINTADNDLSRLTSDYKMKELELFKRLIISIVSSDSGKVPSSESLNFADEINTSKKEIEEMIIKFSKNGWLLEKDGYIFFSTRTIVELQHFFIQHYEEYITKCSICKNVVFQGVNCISCDKKIHLHCKTSYFSQSSEKNTCPDCSGRFE